MTPHDDVTIQTSASGELPADSGKQAQVSDRGGPSDWLEADPRGGWSMAIPADRLYWAVLETPPGHPGRSAQEEHTLRFAFEGVLPVSIDEVEARFIPMDRAGLGDGTGGEGKTIACGVERAELTAWLAAAEQSAGRQGVRSARPRELPRCVLARLLGEQPKGEGPGGEDGQVHERCAGLEFRTGAFECPARRRHRRRTLALLGGALVAASGIGAMGLLAGASGFRAQAAAWAHATEVTVETTLGPAVGGAAAVSPAQRLAAERRRLEQTRNRGAIGVLADDRLTTFIELLNAWPSDAAAVDVRSKTEGSKGEPPKEAFASPGVLVRVDSLELGQDALLIHGAVRDPIDYEKLSAAIKGFDAAPGRGSQWSEPTGHVSALGTVGGIPGGYAFDIAMHRVAQAPSARPARQAVHSPAAQRTSAATGSSIRSLASLTREVAP